VPGPLFLLLEKRTGSFQGACDAIAEAAGRLGSAGGSPVDERLAGLALCNRGESPESVSKHLGWKDFEGFCSDILRAKGYRVRENIFLKKPRAQVDVLGVSGRISLAVDCKHWSRTPGVGTLVRLVEAQKKRTRRLHESLDSIGPIAAVILLMVDPGVRFVDGGAVVPLYALQDFVDRVDSYADLLDLI
jgi:hypothetical protein